MDSNLVSHNINIDERNLITATGINKVVSFDEETVNLESVLGRIAVKGEKLHVSSFDEDIGSLKITGTVHGIIYLADNKNQSGFFSRLFR